MNTGNSIANLHKTVFWQRTGTIILAIFLSLMWVAYAYFVAIYIRQYGMESLFRFRFVELLLFGVMFSLLLMGSFVTVQLFQSYRALNTYIKQEDFHQLELSLRKQRIFWMSLSGLAVFLFMAALAITLVATNNIQSTPPQPPMIQGVEEELPPQEDFNEPLPPSPTIE